MTTLLAHYELPTGRHIEFGWRVELGDGGDPIDDTAMSANNADWQAREYRDKGGPGRTCTLYRTVRVGPWFPGPGPLAAVSRLVPFGHDADRQYGCRIIWPDGRVEDRGYESRADAERAVRVYSGGPAVYGWLAAFRAVLFPLETARSVWRRRAKLAGTAMLISRHLDVGLWQHNLAGSLEEIILADGRGEPGEWAAFAGDEG